MYLQLISCFRVLCAVFCQMLKGFVARFVLYAKEKPKQIVSFEKKG